MKAPPVTIEAATEPIAEPTATMIDPLLAWSVAGTGLIALGLVTWFALSLRSARQKLKQLAEERDAAIVEVRESTTTRRSLRYRATLFRSLLPRESAEQTINGFLKTLLPRLDGGFAAVLDLATVPVTIVANRGTIPASAKLDRMKDQIAAAKATDKPWAAGSVLDGAYLVPINERFAILASSIGPTDIPRSDVREILNDCLEAVGTLAESLHREVCTSDELRMTREMLALHEIAGSVSDNPEQVLSEYLRTLLNHQSFDRAALFVATYEHGTQTFNRIGQSGRELSPGLAQTAAEHEIRLAIGSSEEQQYYSREQLAKAGVDSLFGSALTLPLTRMGRVCGVLVLSAAANVTRDGSESRLLTWAGRHLVVLLESLRDRVSMERRATRDGLTGLYNRAELDSRLQAAVANADATNGCTLILFDLDRFKNVNDTYGHAAGDTAIRHVATIMQATAIHSRAEDEITVARYGGEELCILMPKAGLSAGLRIADQVRREVATTPFQHDGRTIPLTISAGVAVAPIHGRNPAELLAAADASLYTSKQLGRNRVTDASSIQSLEALKDSIQRNSN